MFISPKSPPRADLNPRSTPVRAPSPIQYSDITPIPWYQTTGTRAGGTDAGWIKGFVVAAQSVQNCSGSTRIVDARSSFITLGFDWVVILAASSEL